MATANFERNRTICGGVIAISVFDLITLNMFCCLLRAVLHCVAAEHGGLIKKEREKKEISWVKLKAFPTNVGRPNNK